MPPDVDVKNQDAGEGEGEDGEAGDKEIGDDIKAGTAILSQISNFESVDENLYKDSNLFQDVDQLTGICPTHYANIQESTSQRLAMKAAMDCREFAVVAFWDLNAEDDTFKCVRFFIMPNPIKRTIMDKGNTKLDQILYTSSHTKDVFFFFKGYQMSGGDDLDEVQTKEHVLQIGFLDLDMDQETIEKVADARNIRFHCKDF